MTKTPQSNAEKFNTTLTRAYEDHEKALHKHSFFKLHEVDLSQDLVQDTFMKTWMYLMRGGKIDVMRAFLYHTLNCLIIDEYRKRKTTSLDVLLENGFEPGISTADREADVFDGKIAFVLMQQLPEKYRTVMHLRFEQHLSLKEIAVLTHQTKNTVAVQIHRGLKQLRVLYTNKQV